jgi:mannose-1-phosphate guanylyltransferase
VKIIVTAGGQGTKMWPYSRQDKPKQFQPIIGERTSYQQTIDTLLEKFTPEDIYISTKRKFIKYVSEQSPQIPLRNYIVEPDVAKDRGPGEGLAFVRLSIDHPDEPFMVVQADCVRDPADKFLAMIEEAGEIVAKHKKMLTGGIKATEAAMGVDYLKLGNSVPGCKETYTIDEFLFRRKTLRETKQLVGNFHVVTHTNHMCWYPDLMLEAYKKYRPDWYEALMKIKDVIDKPGEGEAIETIYNDMEKGATEEVTTHVMNEGEAMVMLLPFKWTDVGTWGSVYDFFAEGSKDNYEDGNVVAVATKGSLIKTSRPDKLIAVAGLEDMIVIDTEDALLVIPKDDIEKIKDIQQILAEREETEYL